jgi:hypothetical protein
MTFTRMGYYQWLLSTGWGILRNGGIDGIAELTGWHLEKRLISKMPKIKIL